MKILNPYLFTALIGLSSLSLTAGTPVTSHLSIHTKQEKEVKNFTGVAAGGPIEVIVTLGNKESVRFEGDAEAISTLVTEVKSNILIIRPQTSWKSWAKKYENKKIVAHVTAKNISSLTMSGDGSINVTSPLTASKFAATLSGSGSIKATVDTDEITGVISGSGTLSFKGKAKDANVTISGSGSFAAKTFTVEDISAQISGSGTVYITANSSVELVVSGSGRLYYAGDAETSKTGIGSGGITKL